MTLGTGIFASTVLVLLAIAIWQITARHKWKLTGKIAAGFVAVCAVIGGGLYAWNYIANLPPAPSVVTELAGVKLGMSPTDVTLALGKPDTAEEPTIEGAETSINFSYVNPQVSITFRGPDKFSTRATIVCTNDAFIKLLGFDNYSSEDSVIQRLGTPDSTSIAFDGLRKMISYSKWHATFSVSKGIVTERCVHSFQSVSFVVELPSPAEEKAAAEARAAALAAAEARAAAVAAAEARARAAAVAAAEARARAAALAAAEPMARAAAVAAAEARARAAAVAAAEAEPYRELQVPMPLTDPCAPNLTKEERIRRLANYGAVREIRLWTYSAGPHLVSFLNQAGQLAQCY